MKGIGGIAAACTSPCSGFTVGLGLTSEFRVSCDSCVSWAMLARSGLGLKLEEERMTHAGVGVVFSWRDFRSALISAMRFSLSG